MQSRPKLSRAAAKWKTQRPRPQVPFPSVLASCAMSEVLEELVCLWPRTLVAMDWRLTNYEGSGQEATAGTAP
ncbi:hypothetical protein BD310DRAFT_929810 [Dichomitus squalens]|uniref:Uncharacterized protein n=1 Tax=Dichomitus squalens TaxID=114155 RepID=A0A4Q9PS63_9APHY|nr:hypothetical protein BD310DRAFT_929810 [Dichomitus squalens]